MADPLTRVYLDNAPPSRLLSQHERRTVVALGDAREHAAPLSADDRERYTLVRTLGQGGMGIVEACEDRVLARLVARKRLLSLYADDVRADAALSREAQLMARMSHPTIMPVYDLGTSNQGPFYTMRVAHDPSLFDWLARARDGDVDALDVLSPSAVLRCFAQFGRALSSGG